MGKKVHVVPHSHWDREWYFTTSRSKIYLMKDLHDVLDTLEKDKDFKFMLDAQASLLDDYLKWMPEDEERIKKFVKEKRLIIGPWYTQTDQMVISAESIVRNMYYGMKRCEEFGGYMNVGYVPDSFGQAGNMPQIYQAFGIKDSLFWRGVSDDMVKHTDYKWQGDDGSEVFVTQIPFGYYIGGNIPEEEPKSEEFWQNECFKKAGARSATDSIYFPNGFDQAPVRKNLSEILEKRRKADPENEYKISTVEEYIADVKSQNPELETVKGELLIAKHMRIHKSIFSSRSDLKVLNTQIQNYVTNIMEPILVMSSMLGHDYPKETVKDIWKLLFENAAHDSIGSCIADTANEDVYVRYKQARDIATNLVELHTRLIATSLKGKENKITMTLFNTLPIEREETIEFKTYLPDGNFSIVDANGNTIPYTVLEKKDLTDYVLSQTIRLNPSKEIYIPNKVYEATIVLSKKDIHPFGYEQLQLVLGQNSEEKLGEVSSLENEYYQITMNKDGSFDVFDKASQIVYKNQGVLVENGDDGDSFNYSPPRKDLEVYSTSFKPEIKMFGSSLVQKASVHFDMVVPSDLEQRANQKTSVTMPVELIVGLRKYSKVIDITVKVDNHGLSHRLCILFDTKMATKTNIADQQFGTIMRPNGYEKEMALYIQSASKEEKKVSNPLEPANWQQSETSWQEPPIAIEPCQSFVSLTNDEACVSVIPQGVREYEIIGEKKDTIRLTLFRTYGFMGKENLLYRPGRASGERIIETPDAQLLKKMEFKCGVHYAKGSFNESDIANIAKAYNTNVEVKEYSEFLNGRLIFSEIEQEADTENQHSYMSSDGKLVVSTIKNAEDGNGMIIRLYNGQYKEAVSDVLRFNSDVKEAYFVNLKEEKTEVVSFDKNEVYLKDVAHCKFVTLKVIL